MNINLPKTYRKKVIEGVSLPGIIKNGKHFFVDLEVYEDGRVECRNFKDFEHFKNDVLRGWVAVNIPDGKEISIHGLGIWIINEGSWNHNKESFINYVWTIVNHLNPNLNKLYKHYEKKVNGVIIGESGRGIIYKENNRIENDPFPEKVAGKGLNVFFRNGQKEYSLVRLDMYSRDSIIVSRHSKPFEIDLVQLEKMISDRKIITEVPSGANVEILGLGRFKIKEQKYSVKISEKFLEIKDTLRVLNGEPSAVAECRSIYDRYINDPTEDLKDQLKEAYENIPEHNRIYVGDMDVKDIAVRMIIYGEEELENWSHYQVAKRRGKELPKINIPKPENY